ncbi:MAG: metallophosphoesterase [Clostridiales bacterium]|nr:metallophosphoesterase [Clostridiales bacterium]
MYIIAAAIGLIMLLILWSRIEMKILTTTEYIVETDKLGSCSLATNFIVLADLHNHVIGQDNKKIINKIDSIDPDFIVSAGDLITKGQLCIPSNGFDLLKKLSKKYTIYYGYGNHEIHFDHLLDQLDGKVEGIDISKEDVDRVRTLHSNWLQYKNSLKDLGIIILDDEQTLIKLQEGPSRIRISGLSLEPKYYRKFKNNTDRSTVEYSLNEKPMAVNEYLNNNIGQVDDDEEFNLLIAHSPIYFEDYVKWGADLTVSGHIHGGMIRIPFIGGLLSPQVSIFPKFDSGRFTKDGKDMIISRGLGSHSLMIRIFNPPELLVIRLQNHSSHS